MTNSRIPDVRFSQTDCNSQDTGPCTTGFLSNEDAQGEFPTTADETTWNQRDKLKRILIVVIVVAAIIALTISLLFALKTQKKQRSHRIYNVTTEYLTDGEAPAVPLFSIGAVIGDTSPIQDSPLCTHESNGDYSSSSKYSTGYSAINAVRGPRRSWSSTTFTKDDFEKQWIQVVFNAPKKIRDISFRGDYNYPDNSPTVYELFGREDLSAEWNKLMEANYPNNKKAERRTHEIKPKKQNYYKEYKLLIHQTVWMEKGPSENGCVQISFLEMCWEQNDPGPKPPRPAPQTGGSSGRSTRTVVVTSAHATSETPMHREITGATMEATGKDVTSQKTRTETESADSMGLTNDGVNKKAHSFLFLISFVHFCCCNLNAVFLF